MNCPRAILRWSNHPLSLPLFIAVTLFSLASSSGAQESDALKKEFITQAPKRCKEYRNFAKNLEGSASYVLREFIREKNQTLAPQRVQAKFKQNARCALVSYEVDSDNIADAQLRATNPDYAFKLITGKRRSEWILAAMDREILDGTTFDAEPIRQTVEDWCMFPFDVFGRRLDELISDPSFQVTNVTNANRNAQDLVKVEFSLIHDFKERPFYPVQSGSLFLDPKLSWCLREIHFLGKWSDASAVVMQTNEFTDSDGHPIATRTYRKQTKERSSLPYLETTFEFDFRIARELPQDNEFRLAAFGLPEPRKVKHTGPSLYICIAGTGFFCLFGGMVVWRFMRRQT